VFYVGGVTSAEISVFFFIRNIAGLCCGCNFIVGTTAVITGDDLVDCVVENID
jgi:hypothetical protein